MTTIKLRFKKKYITRQELFAFLLLLPFVQVTALDVGKLYDVALMVVMCYVCMLVIKNQIKFKVHDFMMLLYAIWLMFSCFMNNISILPPLFYGGRMLSFVLINEFYLQSKSLVFLNVTRKYLGVLVVVTTVFQYLNQDLFGTYELSGNFLNFSFNDNELGYYYIAFLALCLVLDWIQGKKISKYTRLMIIVCLTSLVRAWSGKSIVGIALIIVYVLFVNRKKLAKVFNYKFIVTAYMATYIGLVVFNLQERLPWLLEALGKDVTLSGRTYIWQSAMANISLSPIYGYGVSYGGRLLMNSAYSGRQVSSHNLFLEILLQVGVIGLILFGGFVLTALHKNLKGKTEGEVYSYLMLLFFAFVILIMYITTASVYIAFAYLPLILCANLDRFLTNDPMRWR